MSRRAVAAAHERLQLAEQAVRDAVADRDAAQVELDQALAVIGWHRLGVVLGEGRRLYESKLHPGVTLELADVFAVLAEQEASLR